MIEGFFFLSIVHHTIVYPLPPPFPRPKNVKVWFVGHRGMPLDAFFECALGFGRNVGGPVVGALAGDGEGDGIVYRDAIDVLTRIHDVSAATGLDTVFCNYASVLSAQAEADVYASPVTACPEPEDLEVARVGLDGLVRMADALSTSAYYAAPTEEAACWSAVRVAKDYPTPSGGGGSGGGGSAGGSGVGATGTGAGEGDDDDDRVSLAATGREALDLSDALRLRLHSSAVHSAADLAGDRLSTAATVPMAVRPPLLAERIAATATLSSVVSQMVSKKSALARVALRNDYVPMVRRVCTLERGRELAKVSRRFLHHYVKASLSRDRVLNVDDLHALVVDFAAVSVE